MILLVTYDTYRQLCENMKGKYVLVASSDPNHFFEGFKRDKVTFLGNYLETRFYSRGGKYSHVRHKGWVR